MAIKFGNGIDVVNQKIINLADPSAGTDAANKQYVDAFVRGLSWKASVIAASTANVTVSSAPASLDGVTLTAGDRVLLKNQTTASENGIYTFSAAASALTRASDADTAAELIGATVTVTQGSTNADKVFRLLTDNVTLGTTSLSWTELGGSSAAYTAGAGLTESPAGTFNVGAGTGITVNADDVALSASVAGAGLTHTAGVLDVNAGSGLEISADTVRIAAAAAGNGLTGGAGSALAVGAGTGISVAADAVSVDSTVVRQYSANIGDGSTTNIVVTHSLGTRDVQVTVRNASSPYEQILVDNEATTTTTVTLKFAVAPTSNQYRVIVQGAA